MPDSLTSMATDLDNTATMGALLHCVVCDVQLPLRMPQEGEPVREWACIGCGSTLSAVFDPAAPSELQGNAQVVEVVAAAPAQPSFICSEGFGPHGTAITSAPAREPMICRFQTSMTRQVDSKVDDGEGLDVRPNGAPFVDTIQRRPSTESFDVKLAEKMSRQMDESVSALREMFVSRDRAGRTDISILPTIAEQSLKCAAEDLDLFVSLGLNKPGTDELATHSLHAGILTMALAANLGWDAQTVSEAGLGCLCHDAGMLQLKDRIYARPRVLQSTEFLPITRHPIYTLELLGPHLDELPKSTRIVAYQLHERCNGTGYPRGRKGDSIHELAKIAAVADVFVALTSTRPHRPGMIPYYAMEQLVRDTSRGLFDARVVRALLKTVSLFPLGSYVVLNDGRAGKVLRSNGENYAKPVVEVYRRNGVAINPDIIDLAQADDLQVARAVASLPVA
jgi:HD-GYP domain-containing protein (c-di-GMP phosphodiesterase class II)